MAELEDQRTKQIRHPLIDEGYESNINETVILEVDGVDTPHNLCVFHKPEGDGPLEEVIIEITREDDVFYVARAAFDEEGYNEFRKSHKIRADFNHFISTFSNILKSVQTNRAAFVARFNNESLNFKQKLEFKSVDILTIDFQKCDENDAYVMELAQYRHDTKLNQIEELTRAKEVLQNQIQAKTQSRDATRKMNGTQRMR